jgi:hypothetical protein
MLLAAMVVLIVGYSMIYAALHGDWAFWQYWKPAAPVNVNA